MVNNIDVKEEHVIRKMKTPLNKHYKLRQILSSLLSLIMTEVRSKRRAFFPITVTSICFKKPLLITELSVGMFAFTNFQENTLWNQNCFACFFRCHTRFQQGCALFLPLSFNAYGPHLYGPDLFNCILPTGYCVQSRTGHMTKIFAIQTRVFYWQIHHS